MTDTKPAPPEKPFREDLYDAITEVFRRHYNEIPHRYMLVAEVITEDGVRGLSRVGSPDLMLWDVLGLLRSAVVTAEQQAADAFRGAAQCAHDRDDEDDQDEDETP